MNYIGNYYIRVVVIIVWLFLIKVNIICIIMIVYECVNVFLLWFKILLICFVNVYLFVFIRWKLFIKNLFYIRYYVGYLGVDKI